MSAYDDLRRGVLSDDVIRLLYRTVAEVARARNYPHPPDHPAWTVDAVREVAHDFWTARDPVERFAHIAAQASDEQALNRLLAKAVTNHFRERSRGTALGKLIRSLGPLLDADPRFSRVKDATPGAGNIRLVGEGDLSVFNGRETDLIAAAYSVDDVRIVRWSEEARRDGPLADGPSLLRIAEAVLTAANASMSLPELARVIGARFGIDPRNVPATVVVDDADTLAYAEAPGAPSGLRATTTEPAAPDSADAQDVAAFLAGLSLRELLVVARIDATVRSIADETGLAVSTAGTVKQRLVDKLRVAGGGMSADAADRFVLGVRDAARAREGLDRV